MNKGGRQEKEDLAVVVRLLFTFTVPNSFKFNVYWLISIIRSMSGGGCEKSNRSFKIIRVYLFNVGVDTNFVFFSDITGRRDW